MNVTLLKKDGKKEVINQVASSCLVSALRLTM